jgi:hypothetical protein
MALFFRINLRLIRTGCHAVQIAEITGDMDYFRSGYNHYG